MSNFGLPPEKSKEARSRLPPIGLASFVDPREPWVLVPDGNLLGFFGWVPRRLRVGPWSRLASPALLCAAAALVRHRPARVRPDDVVASVSSHPEAFSNPWWYNVAAFHLMFGVAGYVLTCRTKGAVVTYTILSWILNATRHLINSLAPFLVDDHALLRFNRVARFPALVSASVTCAVWNFALLPYVYNFGLDSEEKRRRFLLFNNSPRMVQLHVCNVVYAALNTVVTLNVKDTSEPILFHRDDLWYGAAYTFSYGVFYLAVLDRIGVHIYPVFSPRSNFVVLAWCAVFSSTYGFYRFWNWMMVQHWDVLRLEVLLGANCSIVIAMLGVYQYLL